MTVIPKKFIRWSASPILHFFKWLGFRKTVLRLDVGNWFGLPWEALFKKKLFQRLRYEVRTVAYSDLLGLGEPVSIVVKPETYSSMSHRGFRLWELCRVGILASLETPRLPEVPNERELKVIAFYYGRCAQALDGSFKLLESVKPLSVVTVQGSSPMARPFLEAARSKGIHAAGVEGSFLGGYFFCDDATGMIINRHRAANLDGHWLESRDFAEPERQDFHMELQEARANKREEHRTGTGEPGESLRKQLGIAPDQKIAVFIGQVLTDAAVIMDSTVYPDPTDLIQKVVQYFQSKPGWFLIVRLHPKEDGGHSWVNQNLSTLAGTPPGEPVGPLPYNRLTFRRLLDKGVSESSPNHKVIYDRSIATDTVFDEATLGVTVTSQAGFEFALRHKRLVVCGDAFYKGKGFSYDVSHPAALVPTLEEALCNLSLTEDEKFRIDRFGHHLMSNVLFPKSLRGQEKRLLHTLVGP